jgi:hypothetical protein
MNQELRRLQAKEYESAAKEAAKDLETDYGDRDNQEQQQKQVQSDGEQQEGTGMDDAIDKQNSINRVL